MDWFQRASGDHKGVKERGETAGLNVRMTFVLVGGEKGRGMVAKTRSIKATRRGHDVITIGQGRVFPGMWTEICLLNAFEIEQINQNCLIKEEIWR